MADMHIRPAWMHYARFYLLLMALVIMAALAIGSVFPITGMPVMLVAFLLCLIILYRLAARYYLHITVEYVIDSGEIKEITGLWAKDENHVPISMITDYSIGRTLLGKFLGVATIGIQTARAEKGNEIVMRSIPEQDAAALDRMLDDAVRAGKK